MTRDSRGFTLIEVLLAISLMAILLILVGAALTATRKTLASTERFTQRLDEVRAAQQFLRREFQQIVPLPIDIDASGTAAVFHGEASEMRYVASLPPHLGGGLYVQTLRLGNRETDPWLEVSFTQLGGANGGQPWGEPQRLLGQVQGLRFTYRGLDTQGRPSGWLPRWPWPQRLPQAIDVTLASQGPIAWPPLRVALRLQPQSAQVPSL